MADRRQIERDLHDGAQQRLLALGMETRPRAREVRRRSRRGAPRWSRTPTARSRRRSSSCATSRAASIPPCSPTAASTRRCSSLAARSPVPVRLDVDVPERPPASVEATAYFVVAEALDERGQVRGREGAHRARRHAGRAADRGRLRQRRRRREGEARRRARGAARPRRGRGRNVRRRQPARRPDRCSWRSCHARRDRRGLRAPAGGPRPPARRPRARGRRRRLRRRRPRRGGRRDDARPRDSSTSACRRRTPTRASAPRSQLRERHPGLPCSSSPSTSRRTYAADLLRRPARDRLPAEGPRHRRRAVHGVGRPRAPPARPRSTRTWSRSSPAPGAASRSRS